MEINSAAMAAYKNRAISSSIGGESRTSPLSEAEAKRLKEACTDFEALFIKQMLNTMKSTINHSGLIERGMGEEIFEDMLYDDYAGQMAKTSSFGLAKTLYRELSQQKPS